MRNLNWTLLNGSTNSGTVNSDAIDCQQVYALTFVANFSDGSAAGTLKLQGSNDVPGQQSAPPAFSPTNWVDIPSATDTIASGAVAVIEKNPVAFRWVRAVWTSSGGSGTFDVNVNTQGF